MAGTTGLEPATSAVTGQRSNQLSYVPRRSTNNLNLCNIERVTQSFVAFSLFYRSAALTSVRKVKTSNKLIATTLVSVSEDDQDWGAQAGVGNGLP